MKKLSLFFVLECAHFLSAPRPQRYGGWSTAAARRRKSPQRTPKMTHRLNFLDLEEIQDDRCFSTEERDKDRDLVLIQINLTDRPDKLGERSIDHTYALTFRETDFGFGLLRLLRNLLQDRTDLIFHQRHRTSSRADKACDTRRVTYNIPGLIAHYHLHQHIARKDLALHRAPLALFD